MKPEIDEARLVLAGLAMHAILGRTVRVHDAPIPMFDVAATAVAHADCVLRELERTEPKDPAVALRSRSRAA